MNNEMIIIIIAGETRFELFGGNIHGKFVELVPDKKLVLSWRCNQWQAGHFSTVTLDLEEMVSGF